jgi:hypothetical protein
VKKLAYTGLKDVLAEKSYLKSETAMLTQQGFAVVVGNKGAKWTSLKDLLRGAPCDKSNTLV